MDNLSEAERAGTSASPVEFVMATVGNYNGSTGTTLIFDGTDAPTAKRYRRAFSGSLSSGQRVLVARFNGTYLIMGRIY